MTASTENSMRRTRRRRTINRKVPDNTVPSPCIGICTLDDTTALCDGCFRSIDEIREWMIMDKEEKLLVLEKLPLRQEQASEI